MNTRTLASRLVLALVVGSGFAARTWAEQPPATAPKKTDPAAPGAQLVDLRPKFDKGQRVGYVMKVRSTQEIGGVPGGDGKPTKQQTEQEVGLTFRVTEVDKEKGATVEVVYDTVKAKIDNALGVIDFDSTKPEKKPARKPDAIDEVIGPEAIEKALRDMVGTTLTLTIDPNGSITSVKGGEKLAMTGLLGQLGVVMPDAKQMGGLFGPISSRRGAPGQVKVGEKWSYSDAMDVMPMGSIRMTTEHHLTGVRGNLADVFFKGHIEPQSDGSGTPMPMQLKDTSYQGQYVWDTKLGWLEKMTSEQKITIDGKAAGLPGTSKMDSFVTIEKKKGK